MISFPLSTHHLTHFLVPSPHVTEEASRLPPIVLGKHIVVPKSLRNGGHYSLLKMEKGEAGKWTATQVENLTI